MHKARRRGEGEDGGSQGQKTLLTHVPRREREKDEWDAQSPNKNPGELGKRDLFVNGYIPEGFLEEVEWSYILDRTILEGEDDEMSM